MTGSNDHHGGHERSLETFKMFRDGVPWDFAIQARGHHNTDKLGNDAEIWLEKHVLDRDHFWPERPTSRIQLGEDGVPELHVTPAGIDQLESLSAYYAVKNPVCYNRNWRDTDAVRVGDTWVAKLPVLNIDDYVFGYANLRYKNDLVVSTDFEAAIPSELGHAIATDTPGTRMEGTGMWRGVVAVEGVGGVKGFRTGPHGSSTEQFRDPKWQAPKDALLGFKFYCTQPQTVILRANRHFQREIEIPASDDWQSIEIPASTMRWSMDGKPLGQWSTLTVLGLSLKQGSDMTKIVFADFEWRLPTGHEKDPR